MPLELDSLYKTKIPEEQIKINPIQEKISGISLKIIILQTTANGTAAYSKGAIVPTFEILYAWLIKYAAREYIMPIPIIRKLSKKDIGCHERNKKWIEGFVDSLNNRFSKSIPDKPLTNTKCNKT